MDPPIITLGTRLAELRKTAGMTQASAARIQGVELNSWNRWECDRQIPSTERLEAIAKMFGITVSALWEGVELPRKGKDDE